MVNIAEILAVCNSIAPPQLAETWDNIGLILNCGQPVSRALLALEVTQQVANEAAAQNCQLLIVHHPLLMPPVYNPLALNYIKTLIQSGVSVISMHTNFDAAEGGVSDVMCKMLGVADIKTVEGALRVANLIAPLSAAGLAKLCAKAFSTTVKYCDASAVCDAGGTNTATPACNADVSDHAQCTYALNAANDLATGGSAKNGKAACDAQSTNTANDTDFVITTVCVCGGSGAGYIAAAKAVGAQALITGEVSHHRALEAQDIGLSTFALTHFASEAPAMAHLQQMLADALPNVEFLLSTAQRDPFLYI